ncbi:hypothetical protein KIPB_010428, partial [Kipferlia bialata]|eukprot:g10428.t1
MRVKAEERQTALRRSAASLKTQSLSLLQSHATEILDAGKGIKYVATALGSVRAQYQKALASSSEGATAQAHAVVDRYEEAVSVASLCIDEFNTLNEAEATLSSLEAVEQGVGAYLSTSTSSASSTTGAKAPSDVEALLLLVEACPFGLLSQCPPLAPRAAKAQAQVSSVLGGVVSSAMMRGVDPDPGLL